MRWTTALLLLTACGTIPLKTGDGDTAEESDTDADTDSDTDADTDSDTDADTDADTDSDTDADTDSDTDADSSVCDAWVADRADLSEGSWSGSVSSCDAGDISSAGRANALRQVNLYRWMAGLGSVTTDSSKNASAQECALMMDANNDLSHAPPTSWSCYTSTGAGSAGSSNIASGPGVMAVDMYMIDWGNASTMGHRRWILSNWLSGTIGLGSTSDYSCMEVIDGYGGSGPTWTSWPPEGDFPEEAIDPFGWGGSYSLNRTGFTVQSDSIALGNSSTAKVWEDGSSKSVSVNKLGSNYGSSYAISIVPSGWTLKTGSTYEVEVTAGSDVLSWDFTVVDCE